MRFRNNRVLFTKRLLIFFLLIGCCTISYAQRTSIFKSLGYKDTVVQGFQPKAGSDPNYRIYVGVAYNIVKRSDTKKPYAASHTIGLNFSLSEISLHPYYESFYPEVFGQWGINFKVGYDGIRRANYFGLGNETQRINRDVRFNWVRSHHQYASLGISRPFGNGHKVDFSLLYSGVQILNDKNRFINKDLGTIDPADFEWQNFVGSQVSYFYSHLNRAIIPTKGFVGLATAGYQESLKRGGHSFGRYSVDAAAYFPLSSEFSYVLKGGVSTISGAPDFYQYNVIGGNTLRGYHRWRFYGKTAFYNQNELRWVRQVDNGGVTSHFGLFALYDVGCVWLPGESSDKLHFGYGVGILLAPMDKITVSTAYAISNEDKRFHFSVGKYF